MNLAHFFIPHEKNNHKAGLLSNRGLVILALTVVVFQFLLRIFPASNINILGYAANISPEEVIRLTNEKRVQIGLNELTYNPVLSQAALAKGNDMLAKDYWAHVSPDGTEPWFFFSQAGYKYRYAGENLARDFSVMA